MAALMEGQLILGFVTLATEGALEWPDGGVGCSPVFVEVRHTQVGLATVNTHVWPDA